MVGGITFPRDHYAHKTPVEWWYYFGRLSTGDYFHFAQFRFVARSGAIHFSLHNGKNEYFEETKSDLIPYEASAGYLAKGNRFNFECKKLGLTFFPEVKPVIHDVPLNRNYYSIPILKGRGHLHKDGEVIPVSADAWFDHEFSDINKFRGWDWAGIKLDSGMCIMVYSSDADNFCTVSWGDKSYHPSFTLTKSSLLIDEMGIYLWFSPVVKEEVFKPKFGVNYSEQPFEVVVGDKVIGWGMRERAYGKLK